MNFEYVQKAGQVLVSKVTYRADDGHGVQADRSINFEYEIRTANRVVLTSTKKETVDGLLTTKYTYDSEFRVKTVTETGSPTTTYTYDGFTRGAYDGPTITVTQGEGTTQKRTDYFFDEQGQLREQSDYDFSVASEDDTYRLTTTFDYYETGNLAVVREPSGKATHYGYDERGNLTRTAVYKELSDLTGETRLATQLRLDQLSNTSLYRGEEFWITGTVKNDELFRDVAWYYCIESKTKDPECGGTGRAIYFTGSESESASFQLVDVERNRINSQSLYKGYQVRAKIRVGKRASLTKPYAIGAKSKREGDEKAFATHEIDITSRLKGLTIESRYSTLLYSAPKPGGCVRSASFRTSFNNCSNEYRYFIVKPTFDSRVSAADKRAISESVKLEFKKKYGGSTKTKGYSRWYNATRNNIYTSVEIPWESRYAGKTPQSYTVRARFNSLSSSKYGYQSISSTKEDVKVGYFGVKKANNAYSVKWGDRYGRDDTGKSNKDSSYNLSEIDSVSYLQLGIQTINNPFTDLDAVWTSNNETNAWFKKGSSNYPPGCLALKRKHWGGANFSVTAKIEEMPQFSITSSGRVHNRGRDSWSNCTWSLRAGNGLIRDSGSKLPYLPLNIGLASLVIPERPTPSKHEDIFRTGVPNELQKGFLSLTETFYDGKNRPTHTYSTTNGELPSHGISTKQYGVLNTYTYDEFPIITTGFYQPTYRAIKSVKRVTSWADADETKKDRIPADYSIKEVRRTELDTFDIQGRLTSSKLSWGNDWRNTDYSYYSRDEIATATRPDGTDYQIAQFGDTLKQTITTASSVAGTLPGTSQRATTFAYDRLGNVVLERRSGSASELNDAGVATSDHTTKRAYNGYGQLVWEQVSDDNGAASESGFTYHPSGELALSWTGRPENLSVYTYYKGDKAGLLEKREDGIGSGAWTLNSTLTTTRATTTFDYDAFRRNVSETRVLSDTEKYTTSFVYNARNQLITETMPDPSSTTLTTAYDVHGEVDSIVGPEATYTWTRDTLGNLSSESVVPSDIASTPGITRTYETDPLGRVLTETTSDTSINKAEPSALRLYAYDHDGNLACTIAPALRTATVSGLSADLRRPGTAYRYDALGRLTSETQLLYGSASRSAADCGLGDEDDDIATTTFSYDALDNQTSRTDAAGYKTTYKYDALSRTVSTEQQISATESATTLAAYDAAGRITAVSDELGNIKRSVYDTLGNITNEFDRRGYEVKRYDFTEDGLLENEYQPKTSAGDGTTSSAAALTMELTKTYVYDQKRPLPSEMREVHQDSAPENGAKTMYSYDYADRVISTGLPDGSTTKQTFDYRGNELSLTRADGVVKNYSYDYANNKLSEVTEARTNNVIDAKAGLANGLNSTFAYDAHGNLIREITQGLTKKYIYNSLGKVIAETRPSSAEDIYRYYSYRADGALVSETGYGYADDDDGRSKFTGKPHKDTAADTQYGTFSVTSSNIKLYSLDKLGNISEKRVLGVAPGAPSVCEEEEVDYLHDGRGLVTKRSLRQSFCGARDNVENDYTTLATVRDPDTGEFLFEGGHPYTAYDTRYIYNVRGELTQSVNEVTFPGWSTAKQFNSFTYSYSPTGKQLTAERDLSINVQREVGSSLGLAASDGDATSTYNERDLLKSVEVDDNALAGETNVTDNYTSTTYFNYYKDGRVNKEEVVSADYDAPATMTYSYDMLGRVSEMVDSNGTTVLEGGLDREGEFFQKDLTLNLRPKNAVGMGSATVTITRPDDKVIKLIEWDSGCSHTESVSYALGSYEYERSTNNTCFKEGESGKSSITTYTTDARVEGVTSEGSSMYKPNSIADYIRQTSKVVSQKNSYDTFGDRIKTTSISTSHTPFFTYRRTVYVPDEYKGEEACPVPPTRTGTKTACIIGTKSTQVTESVPERNTDKHSVKTFDYDINGNLLGETTQTNERNRASNQPENWDSFESPLDIDEKSGSQKTYVLNSRGSRLQVFQTKYDLKGTQREDEKGVGHDGYIKRYDADGRVSMFFRASPDLDKGVAAFSDFLYDPFGNLVLSSTSGLKRNAVNNENLRVTGREYNSTYFSGQEAILTRKQYGNHKGEVTSDKRQVKDRSFSRADGAAGFNAWEAVVLFSHGVASSVDSLSAPVQSLSATLQINPLDVQAPESQIPDVPASDEVEAPEDAPVEEVEDAESSLGLKTLVVGQSLSAPAAENVQTGNTPTLSSPNGGAGLLPESIHSAAPNSVSSPEQTVSFGQADEVVAPSSGTALPNVGISALDSPIDVVAPNAQDLTPALPSIGDSPNAIEAVLSPSDYDSDIELLELFGGESTKNDSCSATRCVTYELPDNLQQTRSYRIQSMKDQLGKVDSERREIFISQIVSLIAIDQEMYPEDLVGLSYSLNNMGPDLQVYFIDMIQQGLGTGQINADGLHRLSEELRNEGDPRLALDLLETFDTALAHGTNFHHGVTKADEFGYYMKPLVVGAIYEGIGGGLLHGMHRRGIGAYKPTPNRTHFVRIDPNLAKGSNYKVLPEFRAIDEANGLVVNGSYRLNPTRSELSSLVNNNGTFGKINGNYMYVVDVEGKIIIGSRAGTRMPHPTLVGGSDPIVKGAGMVDIRGGKIYSVNNQSGHFQPGSSSLNNAEAAFKQLPDTAFSRDFQGYQSWDSGVSP